MDTRTKENNKALVLSVPDRVPSAFPFPNLLAYVLRDHVSPPVADVSCRMESLALKEVLCLCLSEHNVTFAILKQQSYFAQFDKHSH